MAATDEKAIHEFPTGTIDDNSLLIMDRPTSTPGEYETEKFAIANLGLKLLGGIDFPSNLDTEEQDIFGAINEVNAKAMNIARDYDPNENWHKGDYCIHENITYICSISSGTTTGTFVPGDWTPIKALDEVKANTDEIDLLNTGKANKSDVDNNTISITKLDPNVPTIYATRRGHVVILEFDTVFPAGSYSGNLYRCSVNPTFQTRAIVAWGTGVTLIDIDTDGYIFFRAAKTITESTYIGGQLVFVTPS